eukprot:3003950-Pyramimonas_sp.AAC.1
MQQDCFKGAAAGFSGRGSDIAGAVRIVHSADVRRLVSDIEHAPIVPGRVFFMKCSGYHGTHWVLHVHPRTCGEPAWALIRALRRIRNARADYQHASVVVG